jgi:hypothetical protein
MKKTTIKWNEQEKQKSYFYKEETVIFDKYCHVLCVWL